jgi:hypothetical protein
VEIEVMVESVYNANLGAPLQCLALEVEGEPVKSPKFIMEFNNETFAI